MLFNPKYVQVPVALVIDMDRLNVYGVPNGGPYLASFLAAMLKDLKKSELGSRVIKELAAKVFNRLDYCLKGGLAFDVQNVAIITHLKNGRRKAGNNGLCASLA